MIGARQCSKGWPYSFLNPLPGRARKRKRLAWKGGRGPPVRPHAEWRVTADRAGEVAHSATPAGRAHVKIAAQHPGLCALRCELCDRDHSSRRLSALFFYLGEGTMRNIRTYDGWWDTSLTDRRNERALLSAFVAAIAVWAGVFLLAVI
jgi:hypothetical protein